MRLEPVERGFRRNIHRERVARSIPTVRFRDRLVYVARRHSRRMARQGRIFHNWHLKRDLDGFRWRVLAELVGVGESVRSLHAAFMDSWKHRKRILRPAFRKIGVGVVARHGRLWVTIILVA